MLVASSYLFLESMTPEVVSSSGSIEDAANVLDCSDDEWTDGGENAEMVLDLKCPEKLLEIQIMNAEGDFRTNSFSIYGSTNSTAWTKVFTGKLQEAADREQVGLLRYVLFHQDHLFQNKTCCNSTKSDPCASDYFSIPVKDFIYLDKYQFYKFQVNSYSGTGGGLKFLKLHGTRLGLQKNTKQIVVEFLLP